MHSLFEVHSWLLVVSSSNFRALSKQAIFVNRSHSSTRNYQNTEAYKTKVVLQAVFILQKNENN